MVVADVDDAAGRRVLDTLRAASFVRADVRVAASAHRRRVARVRRLEGAETPEQREAEAPLVEPAALADAVVELIRDEALAGRVMLLPRGEPRRLLDAVYPQRCCKRV